jgi:hypothetical protein
MLPRIGINLSENRGFGFTQRKIRPPRILIRRCTAGRLRRGWGLRTRGNLFRGDFGMSSKRSFRAGVAAFAAVVTLAAPPARAGCARFACIASTSGQCFFVVFRRAEGEARFALARAQHRWLYGVSQGDTYCARRHASAMEACAIRPVQDIRSDCPEPETAEPQAIAQR